MAIIVSERVSGYIIAFLFYFILFFKFCFVLFKLTEKFYQKRKKKFTFCLKNILCADELHKEQ